MKIPINYLILLIILFSCKSNQKLETVPYVDLYKYLGVWYEIALYPNSFQKNCTNTTAEYILTDKNYIKVINRCNKDSVNGLAKSIVGKAFVTKNSNNSKLKVQFFWPFTGKYWIIGLADDYSWAVVSHPNRKYLWILARKPDINENTYQSILKLIKDKGFEINKLKKTIHKY